MKLSPELIVAAVVEAVVAMAAVEVVAAVAVMVVVAADAIATTIASNANHVGNFVGAALRGRPFFNLLYIVFESIDLTSMIHSNFTCSTNSHRGTSRCLSSTTYQIRVDTIHSDFQATTTVLRSSLLLSHSQPINGDQSLLT
jgi:hypothetical protein